MSITTQDNPQAAYHFNWLDRAVAWISPQAGVARAKARMALNLSKRGGFEGARRDHRASSWQNGSDGANTALWGDLPTLRKRARDLVRNNPLAKRAIDIMTAHSVGCGIVPNWKTTNKTQAKRLQSAWKKFVDGADNRQQIDFYGMQELAVRTMFEAGEILALREQGKVKGEPTLSYLVLEGDHIDHQREGVFEDSVTRLGVVLEKNWHVVKGYYLFQQNPSDAILWGQFPYSRFVPKEGIVHLYRIRRPGQYRGFTEFAPVLQTMRDYADFKEAAIVKARIAACFSAFVTSEDVSTGALSDPKPSANDPNGPNLGMMTPGLVQRLRPGEKIEFASPSVNTDFGEFTLLSNMEAAAGIGVTYNQATGDLRQANYSSLRAGTLEFRGMIEMIQHLTIVPMLLKPIYQDFLNFNIAMGSLRAVDAQVPMEWIPPAWQPIDPIKDMNADIMAVRSGRMSYANFVSSWGNDPYAMVEEIATFNKLFDDNGIVLDSDPRKTTNGGMMQPNLAKDGATTDTNSDNASTI